MSIPKRRGGRMVDNTLLFVAFVVVAVADASIGLYVVTAAARTFVAFVPPRYRRPDNCRCRRPGGHCKSLIISLQQQREDNHRQDDDPILKLPLLESQLAFDGKSSTNKNEHDNTGDEHHRLERLREEIHNAKTAAEFGVRKAQVEFYDAFCRHDIDAMERLWSDSPETACVHPGMTRIEGKDAVMESWKRLFSAPAFPIQPARSKIQICGKTAFCTCVEETTASGEQGAVVAGGRLEAINIYQREGGAWKMILHMAGPIMTVARPPEPEPPSSSQ